MDKCRVIYQIFSPVFFSTSDNGNVVQGLSNIPNDHPVLFVGNHVYMGLDLSCVIREAFMERGIMLRGLAHPAIFSTKDEEDLQVQKTYHNCDCGDYQPFRSVYN